MSDEPVFERAWDAFTSRLHHPDPAPATAAPAAPSTPEEPLSLETLATDMQADLGHIAQVVEDFADKHLPAAAAAADLASKAASSPLVQIALTAALGPELEAAFAAAIAKADAELKAAQARIAALQPAPAAPGPETAAAS